MGKKNESVSSQTSAQKERSNYNGWTSDSEGTKSGKGLSGSLTETGGLENAVKSKKDNYRVLAHTDLLVPVAHQPRCVSARGGDWQKRGGKGFTVKIDDQASQG